MSEESELEWNSLIELTKALFETALIGGMSAWGIWRHKEAVLSLIAAPLAMGAGHNGRPGCHELSRNDFCNRFVTSGAYILLFYKVHE